MLVASNIVKPSGVSRTGNFPVRDLLLRSFSGIVVYGFAEVVFLAAFSALSLPETEGFTGAVGVPQTLISVYSISSILAVTLTRLALMSPAPVL